MNIIKFDIEEGIYLTELSKLTTDYHSHPAVEIILAETGTFTLSLENESLDGLRFAIIDSNIEHKVSLQEAKASFLIIEHRDEFLRNYFSGKNFKMLNGYYHSKNSCSNSIINEIISAILAKSIRSEYDPRVEKIIDFLNKNSISYFDLKKEISAFTFLSDSRISHLFKENTGVSLKKYFVWCKLKNSIHNYLYKKEGLMDAFLFNGFYDQPHFNNSYKSFIGTSPAKTYNSRILQEIHKQGG